MSTELVRWAMAPLLVLATIACLTTHSAASATGNREGAEPAVTAPGPDELYQLGLRAFWYGDTHRARQTFQQLLQRYPNAAVAPAAQFYLAEADEVTGDMAAADSEFQLVVRRYPTSARASEALYKHATILEAAGKTGSAKAAFQEVLNDYPQSDEAVLARDRLRELQ